RSINIESRDIRYKIDKFSLITGVEKSLSPRLQVALNYEYSFVKTTDVKPGVILTREDAGTISIASISPSFFYDTRDDVFDPTSGSLNGIVLKFASRALLSETEFLKATFQSSWFFPVVYDAVFALSFRGGLAFSLDNLDELPLVERFFLGGRRTVRGYSKDTLGPRGQDGDPTGGNIFTLFNSEIRIPVWKGLGVVGFIDGGNVWRTIQDIRSELKFTAGGGLRYKTPVGPVRVDYGFKLNEESGDTSGEVHFSFGHAF
ncbi:outer membrane protein assembly factor, partial [bacterium]|nr:outer membrane protein assembly factor [bacterium]